MSLALPLLKTSGVDLHQLGWHTTVLSTVSLLLLSLPQLGTFFSESFHAEHCEPGKGRGRLLAAPEQHRGDHHDEGAEGPLR